MDRLLGISIENFRSIKALELDLRPMRVLIGENGGGKSSILECFEILRKAAEPRFFDQLDRVHGGTISMQRQGATVVHLRARIELKSYGQVIYSISFGGQPGYSARPVVESLQRGKEPPLWRVQGGQLPSHDGQETVLTTMAGRDGVSQRVRQVLAAIELQVAHEVVALWRQRERAIHTQSTGMREPSQLRSGRRLERGGSNLSSVIHSLRNDYGRDEWDLTLRMIKLGLGQHIEDVTVPILDSGYASLVLRYADGRQVSAQGLSDGQLAFLCFVAIARSKASRSVLLLDEPELHLHPGLLVRVFDMLRETSQMTPVILATHAGSLIDALEDPTQDVSVVSLVDGVTEVKAINAGFLKEWKLPLSQLRAEHGDAALVADNP
jgi:predicted ATPase